MTTAVMSDLACRVPRMPFHAWRNSRRLHDVTVVWEAEPGRLGSWCAVTRTIRMDPRQSQAERRCTFVHESIHAERGHDGCQPPAEELSVRKEAARRLITIRDLVDAVLWSDDPVEIADELWVDVDTFMTRWCHLHPAEKGYLRRRRAAREASA